MKFDPKATEGIIKQHAADHLKHAPARRGDFPLKAELRIVLVGRTGSGKSASGNSILGQQAFESRFCPSSVTSKCTKASNVVNGQVVSVIDTPGLFDTELSKNEIQRELKKCIFLSTPGPHVFLIVMKLEKFTLEQQRTVERIQNVFGYQADNYSMVLFTHGDRLDDITIQNFMFQNEALCHVIDKSNYRYHVFNNKCPNRDQVMTLLEKINMMVRENAGTFYTNEMFQETEREIQKETERILKAMKKERRRAEGLLMAQFYGRRLEEERAKLEEHYKMKARAKAQRRKSVLKSGGVIVSAGAGATIGTCVGTAGGPVCMALGAAVGGAIGAAVGTLTVLTPKIVKALKKKRDT